MITLIRPILFSFLNSEKVKRLIVDLLKDGTEVKSIANRLLLFNPSKPHHSTTCTDTQCRLNVNFNFF